MSGSEEKVFILKVVSEESENESIFCYQIKVEREGANGPKIVSESLYKDEVILFSTHPPAGIPASARPLSHREITAYFSHLSGEPAQYIYQRNEPLLGHLAGTKFADRVLEKGIQSQSSELESMRFLDLVPDEMRKPSFPGQDVLGDRGENLSSVLQAICENPEDKQTLLSWLQELTPMDAADFEFVPDQIGRILVTLVEKNGQRISAYSASDGTLRFLAIIAALLGPHPAKFYFLEELENGIHPTRLHLLLNLIEQQTAKGRTQVVATTHSPGLLRLLSPKSLETASVIYRAPESPAAQIVRLLDLPDAQRVFAGQDLARLHESGWLEDAVAFSQYAEDAEK